MWILSFVKQRIREAPHAPPDRSAFFRYKLVVWIYFLLWLGLGVFLWTNWRDLDTAVSWSLAAIEGILAPDLSIFRRLFESYGSYVRRSLSGDF